jgi:hypothetical protein
MNHQQYAIELLNNSVDKLNLINDEIKELAHRHEHVIIYEDLLANIGKVRQQIFDIQKLYVD